MFSTVKHVIDMPIYCHGITEVLKFDSMILILFAGVTAVVRSRVFEKNDGIRLCRLKHSTVKKHLLHFVSTVVSHFPPYY